MKYYRLFSLLVVLFITMTLAHAQNVPCTGSEFTSNAQFFRAYASAISSDATASKKKAMVNARTAISSQMNAKGESAAKSQSKINGTNMTQLIELIQIAVRQKAANLKVICENSEQTNGKYKTHLVVELAKNDILTEIIEQVKSENNLKGLFEEGKFAQAF